MLTKQDKQAASLSMIEDGPSNPASWHINGMDSSGFTYPVENPDDIRPFWIVCQHSWSITMSALVFAISEEHANEIFQNMVRHAIDCGRQYDDADKGIMRQREIELKNRWHQYLDMSERGVFNAFEDDCCLSIKPAPVNQFYKIGWACNDTF